MCGPYVRANSMLIDRVSILLEITASVWLECVDYVVSCKLHCPTVSAASSIHMPIFKLIYEHC